MVHRPGVPDFTSGIAKSPKLLKTLIKVQRKDYGPDEPSEGDEQVIEGATPDTAADFAAKQRARKNADHLSSADPPTLFQRISERLRR